MIPADSEVDGAFPQNNPTVTENRELHTDQREAGNIVPRLTIFNSQQYSTF